MTKEEYLKLLSDVEKLVSISESLSFVEVKDLDKMIDMLVEYEDKHFPIEPYEPDNII